MIPSEIDFVLVISASLVTASPEVISYNSHSSVTKFDIGSLVLNILESLLQQGEVVMRAHLICFHLRASEFSRLMEK
jgi:hypothetical protein